MVGAALPAPEAVEAVPAHDVRADQPRWGRRRARSLDTAPRPRHFPCFDGLRAVAAVLVVAVHTSFASGFTARSAAGIYTARLEVGVTVFFLISGFLLYRPFAASHIAGGAAPSVGRFWVRRLLRILPAYWLAFAVTTYVMHANTVVPGWRSVLIYLGLVQVYLPSHVLTGITQAWSLCTEVAFYLFLPLYAAVVGAGRRSDRAQLARELAGVAILVAAGTGVRFWLLHLHSAWAGISLEWLPACLDLFALGMLLAVTSSWLTHRGRRPRWLWHPALPWASWAAALFMLWAVAHIGLSRDPLYRSTPGQGMAEHLLYAAFAFFLLLPAVFGPQQRGVIRGALRWKPVAALGVVSYGVYLWHQAWVALFLRWTGAFLRLPLPETFFVVLGLATASATASYLVVERPVLGLKDRLGWWRTRSVPPRANGS